MPVNFLQTRMIAFLIVPFSLAAQPKLLPPPSFLRSDQGKSNSSRSEIPIYLNPSNQPLSMKTSEEQRPYLPWIVVQPEYTLARVTTIDEEEDECPALPLIGHPILALTELRKLVNELMNPTNPLTTVRYKYFAKRVIKSGLLSLYTLIWEIDFLGSLSFLGLQVEILESAIANVKFLKFTYHEKLETVRRVLVIKEDIKIDQPLSCGDQKALFVNADFDLNGELLYKITERAFSHVPANLLKALTELQKATALAPEENSFRDCDSAHFINSPNFYFNLPLINPSPSVALPKNSDDPSQLQNYFELSRCDPGGSSLVQRIDLYCIQVCCPVASGALIGVQVTFRVPFRPADQLETSPLVGSSTAATKLSISLENAERIDAFYPPNGSYFGLRVFAKGNKMIGSYDCGPDAAVEVLASASPQDSVRVNDLLGVFGGWKEAAASQAAHFAYFGFVRYV